MRRLTLHVGAIFLLTLVPIGCGDVARVSIAAGSGATPVLPPERSSLLPTVHIAPAKGWPSGQLPTAAPGLAVNAFASGLSHPRWLLVLPNGDVLVAESNAPAPAESQRKRTLKERVMAYVMKRAGAGVVSPDRITLLRDSHGDGVADQRFVFAEHLRSPFGMALVGDQLYVADTDAIIHFTYHSGDTQAASAPVTLASLPAGPINHHWTKNVMANSVGTRLYVTVGSNSNVAENGMANEVGRAAIWEIALPRGESRIFATGLRNPNGMAWEPNSDTLYTVVNERDELGSDLVPDYLTSVKPGGFYGWPYAYYGSHVDQRVKPARPDLVANAVTPDYALGAHTASLGLAWSGSIHFSPPYRTGMFIGQHGSWNRQPLSGYKVVFVPFVENRPVGIPLEVLTGFINDRGEAYGRPVGVAILPNGALLVADDVGNTIWRVTDTRPPWVRSYTQTPTPPTGNELPVQ